MSIYIIFNSNGEVSKMLGYMQNLDWYREPMVQVSFSIKEDLFCSSPQLSYTGQFEN